MLFSRLKVQSEDTETARRITGMDFNTQNFVSLLMIVLLLFFQKQNLTQSISAWSMQTRLVSWRIEHGK
jgi:hypothetical protein